jgi:hypothetical protein
VRVEGPSSPENLSRFLGAPVAVTDLIDILLGVAPARAATGALALDIVEEDQYRLTVPFDGGVQALWFAGDTLELRRAEEWRSDTLTLQVTFDDYQDGFPRSLGVTAPLVGSSVQLAYDSVELNPTLDAPLFAPPPAPRVAPLESATTSG